MWTEINKFKELLNLSKPARDFLRSHDLLHEFDKSEFESILTKDIPAFFKSQIVNNKTNMVNMDLLKNYMGVFSFAKYLDFLGFM